MGKTERRLILRQAGEGHIHCHVCYGTLREGEFFVNLRDFEGLGILDDTSAPPRDSIICEDCLPPCTYALANLLKRRNLLSHHEVVRILRHYYDETHEET